MIPRLQWTSLTLSRKHAEPSATRPSGPMAFHFFTSSLFPVSCSLQTKQKIYKLPGFELLFIRINFSLLKKCLFSPRNMDFLYHVPALAPPAGVTSNFINPESQSLMVIISSILCLVLTTVISSLRFYTNFWINRSLKADDSKYP